MNLISKKDLLAMTSISYGQLYRWKRERLIPEEWFIKQSSYTGQETFFPRDQILSRIQSILDAKDKYSLEELAKILSPVTASEMITREQLTSITEIDPELFRVIFSEYGKQEYEIYDIALFVAITATLSKPGLLRSDAEILIRKAASFEARRQVSELIYTAFFADGNYYIALSKDSDSIQFDSSIKIIDIHSLREIISRLSIKYRSLFDK